MTTQLKDQAPKLYVAQQRTNDSTSIIVYEAIADDAVVIIGLAERHKLTAEQQSSLPTYSLVTSTDDSHIVREVHIINNRGDDRVCRVINQDSLKNLSQYYTTIVLLKDTEGHFQPTKVCRDSERHPMADEDGLIEDCTPGEYEFISKLETCESVYMNGHLVDDWEVTSAAVELYIGDSQHFLMRDHLQWSKQWFIGSFRNVENSTTGSHVSITMTGSL